MSQGGTGQDSGAIVALLQVVSCLRAGVGLLERAGLATVGLNVLQAESPAIGPIRATILQVEHEHTRSELSFFEDAQRGFPDITGFVVNELAAFRLDIATLARVYFVSIGAGRV